MAEGGGDGEAEWEREKVRVEEVFLPVAAVFCVCGLDVETHDCGEHLGYKEDCEAY